MKKYLFIVLLVGVWSCEDSTDFLIDDNGKDGQSIILRTLDEPSGTNCDNSGTKVIYGTDLNSDGVLSDMEIDNSFYICDGTVNDIDGNNYSTITIGNQSWTTENLKTTKYNDGTIIPNVAENSEWSNLSSGAFSFYQHDSISIEQNGFLYNWFSVETSKLCPLGWHIPTNHDWTILERFLAENGGNYDSADMIQAESDNEARSKIGKSMASNQGWANSLSIGSIGNAQENNNYSKFSALPSGSRNDNGTFYGKGTHSRFWTASENGISQAARKVLSYDLANIRVSSADKKYGFCIRCVKDD